MSSPQPSQPRKLALVTAAATTVFGVVVAFYHGASNLVVACLGLAVVAVVLVLVQFLPQLRRSAVHAERIIGRKTVWIPSAATLVIGSIVCGIFAASGHTTTARTSPTASTRKPTATRQAHLSGTLEGIDDTTHQTSFTKTVAADYTDNLRFTLTLRNAAPAPTPDLDVELLWRTGPQDSAGQTGLIVAAAVGQDTDFSIVPGAQMTITTAPGTDCLASIHAAPGMQLHSSDGTTKSLDSAGGYDLRPYAGTSPWTSLSAGHLGILPGRHTAVISLSSRAGTSDAGNGTNTPYSPFEFGHVTTYSKITHPGAHASGPWHQIGSASPGDLLAVDTYLGDSACDKTVGDTLLKAKLTTTGQVATLTMSVSPVVNTSDGTPPHETLATVTISAADNRGIKLNVIPATTHLYGYKPRTCSAPILTGTPPGVIDRGGVDIGDQPAYIAHDPCEGSDLNRWVRFDVRVAEQR